MRLKEVLLNEKKHSIDDYIVYIYFNLNCRNLFLANPIDVDNLKNYDFDVIDDNTNHTTSAPLSFLTFVVYFIFFVLIAGLAYLTTRWIGKQQKKIRAKVNTWS